MNRFRRLVVLAVWFAVLLGLAAPALAENGRQSYMYDVYTGFKFREYYDNNSDNASSYVFMANCRATVYAPRTSVPRPLNSAGRITGASTIR